MTIPTDFYCRLTNRTIIEIKGNDREVFLQGIITQDVKHLESESILYSLMLSPQGKFQFDFFIIQVEGAWLIDVNTTRAQVLVQRLQLFKLRADISIQINVNWQVGVSSAKLEMENCFSDPRLKDLGYRFYDQNIIDKTPSDDYEILRLSLGIPDGAQDMIIDKSIPLEWGMDELHAISWNKGCYMGQELTARSRYVGQIRKRVFPITFKVPGKYAVGEKFWADGQEVGELRAINDNFGLAILKLEALKTEISMNNYPIEVHKPSWMILPE